MMGECDKTMLEQLIDRDGLEPVLRAIEEICHGKAEHVLTNWQDEKLARTWNRAGVAVGRAAANLPVLP